MTAQPPEELALAERLAASPTFRTLLALEREIPSHWLKPTVLDVIDALDNGRLTCADPGDRAMLHGLLALCLRSLLAEPERGRTH